MRRSERFLGFLVGLALSSVLLARSAQVLGAQDFSEAAEKLGPRAAPSVPGPADKVPIHEAFRAPAGDRQPEHIDQSPPPAIVERPGEAAPSPKARWVEGYWEWNPARKDFDWVTGTWRIPPPGKFWVNGYWRRDEQGWFRVPGFWAERQGTRAQTVRDVALRDWRREGPPPERPDDPIGPAPGPNYFYVPGEYVPEGDRVVWKPGFWTPSHPGWEWMPARWVREAGGWNFREGRWVRVPNPPAPLPRTGSPLQHATMVSNAENPSTTTNGVAVSTLEPLAATALRTATATNSEAPNDRPGAIPAPPPPGLDSKDGTILRPLADATPAQTGRQPDLSPADGAGSSNSPRETLAAAGPDSAQAPGAPSARSTPGTPPRARPTARPTQPAAMYPTYYAPRPLSAPGRAMWWNVRSAVGGFLNRVLP
jgi:hypothetical protein